MIDSKKNTILTLDGRFWDKQELLEKMMDDEFYYNYLGVNALSSSACKKLLDSPKAYQDSLITKSSNDNPNFRIGHLFHWELLEPERYKELHFVDAKRKDSKVYKEALAEYGSYNTYTITERDIAKRMVDNFLGNSKTAHFMKNTRCEVPAIGEINGLPFRAKADILGGSFIVDLKSTGDLVKFKWSARNFSYDVQAFIYCELFGVSYKNFTFVAVDKNTGGLGIFECSREFYESGKHKTNDAINIYKDFFVNKVKSIEEFYLYDVL